MTNTRWLRRELLLWLSPLVLTVVVAAGALGTYTAQRLTNRVYDRWLLDAAHSLAGQVKFNGPRAIVDLPVAAASVLSYDEVDRTYFSVNQGAALLAGEMGIPARGPREEHYPNGTTYDGLIGGRPVRVAAVRVNGNGTEGVLVLAAETTLKRQHTQEEILFMLIPMGLLLMVAFLGIYLAVLRTIRPLEAIASRWNEHSHVSLQPIAAEDVPRELTPFASALNDLLTRIRAMLARERQFAATVAHQLRTPLTGLQLGLARAAEAPDMESTRRVIAELGQATLRTSRLVQQLLSLGGLDPEARGDLVFVATDLMVLAQDVGAAYLDFAASKSITLELDAPSHPVMVSVQPDLISEALGNLLDNAVRYTPPGGRVLIEFETDPPGVRVSDSGPGIPEGEREAVLERFVRGYKNLGEGSGLGLAIVRDIVAMHDATLKLGCSNLGGTSVTIQFKP